MTAATKNLTIEQGATFDSLAFQWCGSDGAGGVGNPYDLTGYTARMQVRTEYGGVVLLDATTENGKIVLGKHPDTGVVDMTTGWIWVIISATDTDALDPDVKGKYDLEVESPTGVVRRLLQGAVKVNPNITRSGG